MLKLFIFAVIMLALSGLCNGQGVTTYGASRPQDTSKTKGQQSWTAYAGSSDTMVAIILPNGDVKKLSKSSFGTLYSAGYGINLTGSVFSADTTKLATLYDVSMKLNISDSSLYATQYDISGKLNIADTPEMLAPYLRIISNENQEVNSILIENGLNVGGDITANNLPTQEHKVVTISPSGVIGESVMDVDTFLTHADIPFTPAYVYNVLDSGATNMDTTDDAEKIQNTINAAAGFAHISFNAATGVDSIRQVRDSMNGGVVWFPKGKYYLKRRLVKSVVHLMLNGEVATTDVNSQLYYPYSPVLDTNDINPLTIELEGEIGPNLSFETPTRQVGSQNWDNGVRIISTISNDASTFPAIISSVKGDAVLGSTWPNNIFGKMKNLWVTSAYSVSTGTQLCGIDLQYCIDSWVEGCRVDPLVSGAATIKPTRDVYGIRLTNTGYGVVNGSTNSFASGFTYGFVVGEHAIMDNTQSMINWSGYELLPSFHDISIRGINAHWCKNAITTGYISSPFSSQPVIVKGDMRNEILCTAGFWTTYAYNIKDSLNYLRGDIEFTTRNLGSGCTPPSGTLAIQGGDSLETKRIDASDWEIPALLKASTETGIQVWGVDTTQRNRVMRSSAIRVNNGNVGIGTAAPAARLEVAGTDVMAGAFGTRYSTDASGFVFRGRKSRGTQASPSQVTDGDVLALLSGDGMRDNGTFSGGSKASVGLFARESWTTAANGTYINFSTTPIGSTTLTERVRITNTGDVLIGTTTSVPSAKVVISSTTQGFMFPVMTAAQGSAISSPANGIAIYVTDTDATFTSVGFWGRVAGAWVKL